MVAFTSGSSGAAKPIAKTVGMLRGAAELYEDLLIPRGSSVVETVPPQHMYGLELASLQALWSPVRFTAGKPLFPLEVQQELRLTPAPRVLVTTPLHLRALLESGLEFPALERVLSATAPLDASLALRAETQLATQLLDVYGCSEAGCMASRRLAKETAWQPFPGLRFEHQAQERTPGTVVHGPHLDEPVPLGDRLHFESDGRFHLQGRLGDLINVAGKRGSLGEITRLLLAVPGVEDAAAFLTDTDRDNQRPAALYTGTATTREIRAHLSRELDPVFIPRPLLRVASLPRTASAKLPRDALLACLEAHRQRP
jgi:acyl-coenzyme A synthetase/AMP-(fatty) acid ligase